MQQEIIIRKEKRRMNMNYARNGDLKQHAKKNRVTLWELAEHMGISEPTLSRRLRHELPAEETERYKAAVDQIAAQKAVGA